MEDLSDKINNFLKKNRPIEREHIQSLADFIRGKIRDEDGLRRVMYLLHEAQESITESGLNQDIMIIGSAIVGAQELDVDVYLDVHDVYERDRVTGSYLYLDQYGRFLESFQERLRRLKVPKNYLPSTQVHNLFDRSSQSSEFVYGYRFRISREGVVAETRDHSYSLDTTMLSPLLVNWQNLDQLVNNTW